MGLDMYLSKKTYVKNWNHMSPEELHKITVKKGNKVRKDIKPERITYIVEQVGYWRKFNALHNWFVQNCGEGVDDCREYHVSRENLTELLDNLKKVKESLDKSTKSLAKVHVGWSNREKMYEDVEVYDNKEVVSDLLPPVEGFFFGSNVIGEWYYNEVKETIELIEELLNEDNLSSSSDFYYRASW